MRALAITLLLAACGSSSGSNTDLPDGAVIDCDSPENPEPTARLVRGALQVAETVIFEERDAPGVYARLEYGTVAALFPEGDVWTYLGGSPQWAIETTTSSGCTLHRYRAPLCTDPCVGDDGLCVDTDTCHSPPTSLSVGSLDIGGGQTVLRASSDGLYGSYQAFEEGSLLSGGEAITACAGGGELPAFQITAPAPAPLGVDIPDEGLPLDPGSPLTLSWTPAGDGSRVRLELVNSNRAHGLPAELVIACDVADADGQITVASELIDQLDSIAGDIPQSGICAGHDCLQSRLIRYTGGELVAGDMAVTYEVARERLFWPY